MADNFTFLDAAQATKTARAVDNSTIYLPATVLAAADGTVVAADDAAAAGPIFPVAGVYQSTVDTVDAGDVGRARMSARRALHIAPDSGTDDAFNAGGTGGATDGSIRTIGTVSYYFPEHIRKASKRSILIKNDLNIAVTLAVIIFNGNSVTIAYSASIAAGAHASLTPSAGGTGATNTAVPCLADPLGGSAMIQVITGSSPTSGTLYVYIDWRA